MQGKFVVVTTDLNRRGVFGGVLEKYDKDTGHAELTQAQNCVYWSQSTKGVLGLAAIGPQSGSRIGPPVPGLQIDGVTAVIEATEKARKLWESQPWGK